ncbi:MAG TPA: Crp/Fnr family transcriptional regulator [Acidimicrobiia bacterium]
MPERRLLDTTELFAALPSDVLDGLSAQAGVQELHRNQLLFAQGDQSEELFVVLEGRVAIVTRATDGRESVVAVLERGGLFGELGLFDGGRRSADARALTDIRLLSLGYEPVRRVLGDRPELLWIIVKLLARRLRATDEALADAQFLDVPARTAKRLLEAAGGAEEFRLAMTQEELAGLVGASRERVNKALALFVRLGWVEAKGRGRYKVIDRDALEQRANP